MMPRIHTNASTFIITTVMQRESLHGELREARSSLAEAEALAGLADEAASGAVSEWVAKATAARDEADRLQLKVDDLEDKLIEVESRADALEREAAQVPSLRAEVAEADQAAEELEMRVLALERQSVATATALRAKEAEVAEAIGRVRLCVGWCCCCRMK